MMDYKEVEKWLFALPRFQTQGDKAVNPSLDNIKAFSELLNNPHKKFKSIHVAGTNGKGSTSHMLASVLQEADYKVGLLTSPHLKNFTERIRINGEEIDQQFIVEFVQKHKSFIEEQKLSFYEFNVGLAFDYLAQSDIDIAVLEVGLGGRFDATNIITPEVSVITNIGFDHMKILGDTLPKIAFEKAGIIKRNVPVVIGERQEETTRVFLNKAQELGAEISFASDTQDSYECDLRGDYQKMNVNTAVNALKRLKGFHINEEHLGRGFKNVMKNTGLRGRWEVLQENPKVICDTAHNREGLEYVTSQLQRQSYNQLYIILGFVKDKNPEKVLDLFPKEAYYFFCMPEGDRALCQEELSEMASDFGLFGETCNTVKEARDIALLKAKANDLIFVGGSNYIVGKAM